jgi:hypothetical protein
MDKRFKLVFVRVDFAQVDEHACHHERTARSEQTRRVRR